MRLVPATATGLHSAQSRDSTWMTARLPQSRCRGLWPCWDLSRAVKVVQESAVKWSGWRGDAQVVKKGDLTIPKTL